MFDKPSRVIPKNYRNITGKFSSKKSDRLISYESKLERDFLYLFELNNIVLKIVEQPFTIEYTMDKQRHKYTPDFYLKTPAEYKDIVVEVKYSNELKTIFPVSKYKYKAAQQHIKDADIEFRIYTDRCSFIQSEEYKFNTHFLLNYNSLLANDLHIIQELFFPYISIKQLLALYSRDKYKQLYLLNSLWTMIRRNIIKVDLFEKLTFDTKLLELKKYDEETYMAHLDGKILKGYLL
jgi:hypothetical protein